MSNTPTESAAEIDRTLTFIEDALQRVRACLRVSIVAMWTLALYAARMSALPLALINAEGEHAFRRSILRLWARGVCAIVRARVTVRGAAPRPPFILVSNHLGYFDVIVYARLLGAVFVSMAEVKAWPLIGMLARGLNTLFIDRKKRRDAARVNGEIRKIVQEGYGLVLFPESTTTYGDTLLPFRGPLLQPAIELKMPVHYAAISYRTPHNDSGFEHSICWVDDTPFATHAFRLLRLRAFDVTVIFGESPIAAGDRKQLAVSLHAAVEASMHRTEPKTPIEG
ncbi:MAG: 1-acyl-sn-glycerol-3-phosphate acyltransferase [Candidatus Hydrogenedentes bacterium]|nr:1-acyl-sn-glycerol-3-phosphate acyltransferase [Candidatus Hydrogenedentota bacterium]